MYILDDLNVHKESVFWILTSLGIGFVQFIALFWFFFFLKVIKNQKLHVYIFWFLASIISGGNAEQVCILLLSIAFIYLIVYYKEFSKIHFIWFSIGLTGFIIGLGFSLYGGAIGRLNNAISSNKIEQNILIVFLENLYNIFKLILTNNPAKVKLFIFGLLAFIFINPFWFLNKEQVDKIINQEKLNFKIFAFLIGGIASLAPLVGVMGGLPDSRSFYYFDFFFYLASILLIIKLAYKIKPYLYSKVPELENFSKFLGFFAWFYLLFQASLFFQKEIKFGKKLYEQYESRHNFLKSYYGQKDMTLFVPYLQAQKGEVPRLLYYRDLYPQNHWTNGCMAEYYKVKYIYPSDQLPLGKFGYKKD